jgi:hypothetical protein
MSAGTLVGVVELGYRSVRVVEMPMPFMDNKAGSFLAVAGEIWISAELTPIEKFHTLVHELLHLVYCARQIQPDDGEERTVAEMAEGLVELLVRNALVREQIEAAAMAVAFNVASEN